MQDQDRDLSTLVTDGPPASLEDVIVKRLHSHFKHDITYTRIGFSNLVVINTSSHSLNQDNEKLHYYAEKGYREFHSSRPPSLEPHIYDLATRAYFHMRRTGEDQSVILSGLTGSGKSTSRANIVQELLLLSTHNKKEERLQRRVQAAGIILEQFGHAQTAQSRSASIFGLFHELQFSERGRIVGSKFLTYTLDKHRVTQVPKNERNYHVFYALLAGASDQQRQVFHLPASPQYLSRGAWSDSNLSEAQDAQAFGSLVDAFKTVGFKNRDVFGIFSLVSVILQLGNLEFIARSEAGAAQEACSIKNMDTLVLIADMLGVSAAKLESALVYKLRLIQRELCTVFLDPKAASDHRHSLARAIYHALFLWIIEAINTQLCFNDHDQVNIIGILDQFGFQKSKESGFEAFCANFANERVQQYMAHCHFSNDTDLAMRKLADGIPLRSTQMPDHWACMELLVGKEAERLGRNDLSAAIELGGLAGTLNRDCGKYQLGGTDATDANFLHDIQRQHQPHNCLSKSAPTFAFGIQHFAGTVSYSVDGFLERNLDNLSPDFVDLFRGSSRPFISNLFQNATSMATESHPKDNTTILKAQLTSRPTRAPSMRRRPTTRRRADPHGLAETAIPEDQTLDEERLQHIKAVEESVEHVQVTTVIDQLYGTLRNLFFTMNDTCIYHVIHLRPNDGQTTAWENTLIKQQVRAFGLVDLAIRTSACDYATFYVVDEFLERYGDLAAHVGQTTGAPLSDQEHVEQICAFMNWSPQEAMVGHHHVWLSYPTWRMLEDALREGEKIQRDEAKSQRGLDEKNMETSSQSLAPFNPPLHPPRYASMYDDGLSYAASEYGTKSQWGDESEWSAHDLAEGYGPNVETSKKLMADYENEINEVEVENTAVRMWWVRFVWFMTWWIPTWCLTRVGKLKTDEVRMAWREKVTICLCIFLFSGVVIFFIVGLGAVICPGTQNMYSSANVAAQATTSSTYMSVRGVVYDVTKFMLSDHGTSSIPADQATMMTLAGMDVSYTIPPPLTVACANLVTNPVITVVPNNTIQLGSFIHYSGNQLQIQSLTDLADPNWYTNTFLTRMSVYKKGTLVQSMATLQSDFNSWGRMTLVIDGSVYDITDYLTTAQYYGSAAGGSDYHYLNSSLENLFQTYSGTDATSQWNSLKASMTTEQAENNMNCLNNMFYIGNVDVRDTARCMLTNYLLLAFAILMCLVIVVKFLAALQFGGAPSPEDHDKFVVCLVPCYTEGEESLRKTIDSLTDLEYDDRRKLLFIIADGMIMGSGNDRPTPRIVLDVLGHDIQDDPEPRMFKSVGEGSKQLNYGKIYSGLYECKGHVVPYLVVVKVGKASERAKPGNRGKRDTQMICLNFFNKVHFQTAMSPLELEMYHQIQNIIGVDPHFYEYLLMVDSDTEVAKNALNQMISCMLLDSRIVGLCGETKLSNENASWTTMIQVYEYYISHHLSKAFESLFGSVTCLPGCFCMYRIRTPDTGQPLIISKQVISDYADCHVETLHKKNLLHLGEDRYLTTLMMKHFPQYKLKFTAYAECMTVAPDKWKVLLSQRRRWINSTIHNLSEVVLLPDLCGFCCFSMRFVVLIDLIGTLTLPVTFVYLIYLVYIIASKTGPLPILALAMLAGVYALQALLFILKRQWQHIGWMVFYILAIPVFSFFLPIYSFWHFDDFSWGNTRVVVGENKQKKIIVLDDEKFDEKMIPLKTWEDYMHELTEQGVLRSTMASPAPSVGSYRSNASARPSEAGQSYSSSYYPPHHPHPL